MPGIVLTTKKESRYDDLPEHRYHFPSTYLNAVSAAVGALAVYYEPRRGSDDPSSRGGREAYVAMARIQRVEPDPKRADHFYAYVSDYAEFYEPVPFKILGRTIEGALTKPDGTVNKGWFGRAVRPLLDSELAEILTLGFQVRDDPQLWGLDDGVLARPIATVVLQRPVRDRAFSRVVRAAYDSRCAVTGLRLVNGGGAAEIEAAHIHSVEKGGPDSLRNGIALSRTVHWMFDRFLFTIEDDLTIRLPGTGGVVVPAGLIRQGAPIAAPADRSLRPHPTFLGWHRQRFEEKHGRH